MTQVMIRTQPVELFIAAPRARIYTRTPKSGLTTRINYDERRRYWRKLKVHNIFPRWLSIVWKSSGLKNTSLI